MSMEDGALLAEILDLLKVVVDGQKRLEQSIIELKEENKKLKEEIKLSNFVLNNISIRTETVN